jgi:hypothetical protein
VVEELAALTKVAVVAVEQPSKSWLYLQDNNTQLLLEVLTVDQPSLAWPQVMVVQETLLETALVT